METPLERIPSIFVTILVQLFVAFFLFVGLLCGERELILFCLLLLGMSLGANMWSRLCLAGVKSRAHIDRSRLFPGETAALQAKVENTRILPTRVQVHLPCEEGAFALADGSEKSKACALLWYQEALFQWTLTAKKRGLYQVGPPTLRVSDLFGFFPKGNHSWDPLHVIVYPRLLPIRPFPLKRRELFGIPRATSPVEDPVYVYGTRDYHDWRPARFIHWKASARHSRLQEKVFEPSEQAKVLFALEVDGYREKNSEEAFERSLEVAASLATLLAREGSAVGMVTNGLMKGDGAYIVPITRSPLQTTAILESLARVQMKSDQSLIEILQKGFRLPWGVTCLYFAYRPAESTQTIEAYFRHRHVPMVPIYVQSPPTPGGEHMTAQGRAYTLDDIYMDGVETT